jgi:hypothetical protein
MAYGHLRKVFLGLIAGAALFVVWIGTTIAVGAAASDGDAVICMNYNTCYDSNTGMLVPNPNANGVGTAPTTVPYAPGAPIYAPQTAAYAPSGSGYPPNTVINTYFDPRYGTVSVVTDASGNLIDINAATGQRIYPYPDYGFYGGYNGYNPGVVGYAGYVPGYTGGAYPWNGYGWGYGYGGGYCGTGLYAPKCPAGQSLQPAPSTNVVVGTQIVNIPVKAAEVAAPVQAPAPAPQPAPAAPVVTQAVAAPQAAPAQVATSLSAAQQQPAAPAAIAPAAVPTEGSANGTHVQAVSVTQVVAAPQGSEANSRDGR